MLGNTGGGPQMTGQGAGERGGMTARTVAQAVVAVLAVLAIGLSLWMLAAAERGVRVTPITVGTTPATLFRPASDAPAPVLVIAHGFAGSQQLMQSFGLAAARNGYVAVSYDLAGHGRNPLPLTGSLTEIDGATVTLVTELTRVAEAARAYGDGRLAVLGHSMASDIVVRFAQSAPDVRATIAVSMFSPVVTEAEPANLLVVVGDWETGLKAEALRVVGLATAPQEPQAGVTYGDPAQGTGRRAAFSPHTEHASVLFSQATMREMVQWLDATFGIARPDAPVLEPRGPWIMLLLAGGVALAWPAARLLPVVARPAAGAGLGWRRLWLPLVVPMIATPLLLRVLPTQFLPVVVGDYLAVHFGAYGLITAACLLWLGRGRAPARAQVSWPALGLAALAVTGFGFAVLIWPIDQFLTNFVPGPERLALVAAMLVGTLSYFLAAEWMTRGPGAARGGYAASKLAFLISLGLAVALDFERLFFLLIIVPVIVIYFVVYGLFSDWAYRRTGHPFVAGIANAVAFAWGIGVTFPFLALV